MAHPTPKHASHFWAKQKLTDTDTEQPSGEWEVVQTFLDDGAIRVFVPGFGQSESAENFYWGPEVFLPDEL